MNKDAKTLRQSMMERYLSKGIADFSDEEALALLLSYSETSRDCCDAAHSLIDEYGSLSSVMDADSAFLMKSHNLNQKTADLIQIIPQLSRIMSLENSKSVNLSSSQNAIKYFQNYFIGVSEELLAVVCTDEKFSITAEKTLAFGSAVSVSISCRKIVEFALIHNSSYIFIAHNHPIRNAEPSESDYRSTEIIYNTLKNIGITLVDHIIVARDSATSMKELPYTFPFGNDSSCKYSFNNRNNR